MIGQIYSTSYNLITGKPCNPKPGVRTKIWPKKQIISIFIQKSVCLFLENNNFRVEASEKHVEEMNVKEMLRANSHHNDYGQKMGDEIQDIHRFYRNERKAWQFGYHYTIVEGFGLGKRAN